MIRNPRFDIYRIGKKDYLLPSGQDIQNRSKVMSLGGLATILWDKFATDHKIVDMFRIIEEEYGAENQDDRNIISVDVSNVCAAFIRAGALLEADEISVTEGADAAKDESDSMADGANIKSDSMAGGAIENLTADTPAARERLLESEDIFVEKTKDGGYVCSFPKFDSVEDIYITSGESIRDRFLAYDLEEIAGYDYEMRIASRIPYSFYALMMGRVFIHSSCILYRDRLWLFAAPAGTGKSTHVRMWEKNGSAKIINGDLNLIGRKVDGVGKGLAVSSIDRSGESSCECSCNRSVDRSDESSGEPWVYGTPWCGTSEIYELKDYPLGGIIILRQGYKDYIEDMSYEDGVIGILSRSVSPMWDKKLVRKNVDIISDIAKDIMICKLYCTINDSAYALMKSYIDEYLDGKQER